MMALNPLARAESRARPPMTLRPVQRGVGRLVLLLLSAVLACAEGRRPPQARQLAAIAEPCPDVRAFDTHGFPNDEGAWTEILAADHIVENVRDIVLDNGIARATYEYLNDDQEGSHSLFLPDDSGQWRRMTSGWYGDYSYWISSILDQAASAEITRFSPTGMEVTYSFDHYPAYFVDYVRLVKRVALYSCQPGMFIKFESDPMNPPGEREIGLGLALPLAFSERGMALHPLAGRHLNLGMLVYPTVPYWSGAVGLDDGFLHVLALSRPFIALSYQFDPAHLGRVTVNDISEDLASGESYQAFIGAARYDSTGAMVEAENAGNGGPTLQDASASAGAFLYLARDNQTSQSLPVPVAGHYAVWARYRAPLAATVRVLIGGQQRIVFDQTEADFAFVQLYDDVYLLAGEQTLQMLAMDAAVDLDVIFLVPFGLARDLALGATPVLLGS